MIEYEPEDLEEKRRHEELMQCYRNTFSSMEGRRVLGDILRMCHFGVPLVAEDPSRNEVLRIEYNVGIAIARMSGMLVQIDSLLGIQE